jgi:hypothetical protein
MRVHKRIIVVVLPVLVGLVVVLVASPNTAPPLTASVTDVTESGNSKRVTVELHRCEARAFFEDEPRMQIRIGGKWQPPLSLPRFGHGPDEQPFEVGNTERLEFDFPNQTEACRFLLGYRVGPNPYCRVYFFLVKHGIMQKHPLFCRAVLKWVPGHSKLRHMESEVLIPAAASHEGASAMGRPPTTVAVVECLV